MYITSQTFSNLASVTILLSSLEMVLVLTEEHPDLSHQKALILVEVLHPLNR